MEIIPAIDIIDGKCVRLAQGDFAQATIYSDDPLEVALRFEAAGLKRLHMVDLDGAKTGKVANLKTLERVAGKTDLTIDFGGGVKSTEDLTDIFSAGASMACIGSVAVKKTRIFAEWIEVLGAEEFVIAADVRDGKLAIDGWQTDTKLEVLSYLKDDPISRIDNVLVTDIAKDGLLGGPSIELYKKILNELPAISLIASGGVNSITDVDDLITIGCSGVVIGKAIYEGRITLRELTAYVG